MVRLMPMFAMVSPLFGTSLSDLHDQFFIRPRLWGRMNCPDCGSKTKVSETRKQAVSVTRNRFCPNQECNYIASTVETWANVSTLELVGIRTDLEIVEKIQTALRQRLVNLEKKNILGKYGSDTVK